MACFLVPAAEAVVTTVVTKAAAGVCIALLITAV